MREGQLMAKQVHTSSITHYVETAGPSMDKLIPLPNTTAPWGWHKLSLLDEGTAMSVATNISADPSFKASQKWWQKVLTTQQRNIQANKSRNNNTPLEMKCPKSKKRYKHLALRSFGGSACMLSNGLDRFASKGLSHTSMACYDLPWQRFSAGAAWEIKAQGHMYLTTIVYQHKNKLVWWTNKW